MKMVMARVGRMPSRTACSPGTLLMKSTKPSPKISASVSMFMKDWMNATGMV
jgi:hypothetical protein